MSAFSRSPRVPLALIFSTFRNISTYLDQPHVRQTIGVDASVSGNFSSCSDSVGQAFGRSMDSAFPTQYYISALLSRGVRTLLYVGANDWICNWVSRPNCQRCVYYLVGLIDTVKTELRLGTSACRSRWSGTGKTRSSRSR